MRDQNKNKTKNFITRLILNKFQSNKRQILTVLTVAIIVVVSVGVGFILYQQEKSKTEKNPQSVQAQVLEAPGWWLKQYFGSSTCDEDFCKQDADEDGDRLTNAQEFYYHSDPTKTDTNGNGLTDGEDVAQGFDPSKPGKVTFTEASSEDYIFGESLVFEKDVKNIITEMTDPTKAILPEVKDSEIKIGTTSSKQAFLDFSQATNDISAKYFPMDIDTYIQETISSNDPDRLSDLSSRAMRVLYEIKQLTVPPDCVQLQKYNIGLFTLLPKVAKVPPSNPIDVNLSTDTDPQTNLWYDQAQAYMVLIQKHSIEEQRLELKYKES